MSDDTYRPASPEELEREAKEWELRELTPGGWQEAPQAIPRVGASTTISLRMPTQMLAVLKAFARRERVGYQVLLKRWLDDRIREERDKITGQQSVTSQRPQIDTKTEPSTPELQQDLTVIDPPFPRQA